MHDSKKIENIALGRLSKYWYLSAQRKYFNSISVENFLRRKKRNLYKEIFSLRSSATGFLFSGSTLNHFGVDGVKNLAVREGAGEKLANFYSENEVYSVKIAVARDNLEKFSPPAGYFL